MRYPQQLGRSWKVFGYLPRNSPEPHQPSAPEPSGTSSAICPETFRNFISHLHRNLPELQQLFASAPEPSGTSAAFCTGTRWNFVGYLHRNPAELCGLSARRSLDPHQVSAICAVTLRNLISYLPWECPELHQPSAPEPSGTSSAFCYLHRKPPEPHPEPSGTSSAICPGTLRDVISHLPRNPPELSPEPGVAAAPDGVRAMLG